MTEDEKERIETIEFLRMKNKLLELEKEMWKRTAESYRQLIESIQQVLGI